MMRALSEVERAQTWAEIEAELSQLEREAAVSSARADSWPELGDLRFEPDGMMVRLRRSKGDQEGAGVEASIPLGLDEANLPARRPAALARAL